jgi:hypothetical protein
MTKEPDVFDRIGKFLSENPRYFAVFVIAFGVFAIAAAVFNWDWVFRGHSFNIHKLEGLSNLFGRGTARFVFGGSGLLCVITGIILLLVL